MTEISSINEFSSGFFLYRNTGSIRDDPYSAFKRNGLKIFCLGSFPEETLKMFHHRIMAMEIGKYQNIRL